MKNEMILWTQKNIQFPRLIAEIESVGGFTKKLIKKLSLSMDLSDDEVLNIVDRARNEFDIIKKIMLK